MNQNKVIAITSVCFLAISSFFACNPSSSKSVEGLAPIYLPKNQIYVVEVLGPRPTENAGKIYQYGNQLTLQADVNTGIHVIDCSNASQPQKLKFIRIPGVSEIAVKDNILIANNYNDIVSIDLSNLNSIALVNRTKDVFKANQGIVPNESNVFFECPDETKGVVIGWEKKTLNQPKCKTL